MLVWILCITRFIILNVKELACTLQQSPGCCGHRQQKWFIVMLWLGLNLQLLSTSSNIYPDIGSCGAVISCGSALINLSQVHFSRGIPTRQRLQWDFFLLSNLRVARQTSATNDVGIYRVDQSNVASRVSWPGNKPIACHCDYWF